jgi:hypothetical protein
MLFVIVQAVEAQQLTISSAKEPPRLIVVRHEDGPLEGIIVADGIQVSCVTTGSIFDFLVNLQAAYYAWDLSFPTAYQLATFFQVHVLHDDKDTAFKSAALSKLEKALKL